MAKPQSNRLGPPPKGCKFSGRTIGRMLQDGKKNSNNEAANRKLRQKVQIKPMGKDRFPDPEWPKYRNSDGTL